MRGGGGRRAVAAPSIAPSDSMPHPATEICDDPRGTPPDDHAHGLHRPGNRVQALHEPVLFQINEQGAWALQDRPPGVDPQPWLLAG